MLSTSLKGEEKKVYEGLVTHLVVTAAVAMSMDG